jgi:hypothetical protein
MLCEVRECPREVASCEGAERGDGGAHDARADFN